MANNDLESLIDREISVLMGGWSSEREISLKTGKAVTDSLRSLDLKVIDIDLKSPDDINKIINSLDLVFIALHGRGGEDGYIQRILEENKIQFTGSGSEACGIAMNKSETKKIWRDLSLPTPDFVEILNRRIICSKTCKRGIKFWNKYCASKWPNIFGRCYEKSN